MPNDAPMTANSGLTIPDFAAIVLYFIVTFGIAWWFGRKQESVEDFFVGGRHMPWFAVGLSILATLFSTLSYLATPGEMIKNGIGMFTGFLALPITAIVITYLWIPFFMRLRLTSAYEYLELRFNYAARLSGASLFLLLRLGWMSMVIFAASTALDRIKGGDLEWLPGNDLYYWIGLIGVASAIYTSMGGIQALIWTDVLQCLLLLAGVLMAIGFVTFIDGTGPFDWWRIASEQRGEHTSPPLISFDPTVRFTIITAMIGNFFWNICTHGSDQVVLQRYFSTPSLAAARRSYFTNVAVDLLMAVLLSLAGLALLSFFLQHPELLPMNATDPMKVSDKLFPHFLGTQLPAGCAGLVVAAFLCDAIQTLESGVNAITAVATNDVVPRLRHGGRRKMNDLQLARLLTGVISLIVTANAYFVLKITERYELTLVDLMPKFFNLFVGPLAGMFFVGMFVPRANSRCVLPALGFGVTVSIAWSWWQQLFANAPALTPTLAIALPCLVTIGGSWLLSFVMPADEGQAASEYSWRAVLRRPIPENPPPTKAH